MEPNPYTPGQVARVLAGRHGELDRIKDQLARVTAYGELGGPPLVFHAPRGLGKTSLLRSAERTAEPEGFVCAWVSCTRQRPFLADLIRSVDKALARAEVIDRREAGHWQTRLEKVGVELGFPGFKISGEVRNVAPEQTPGLAPLSALEDLLHDAADRVRRRGGAGMVVFIDELHAASADDMALLLNVWQNLDGRREENPLALITAGLPVTPEALTRAATFGERSTFVALDVLAEEDARAALVAPAEALGVSWAEDGILPILEDARGYPFYLQLMGSCTWQEARPKAGDTIGWDLVAAGMTAADVQLSAMYQARLGAATKTERELLLAMALVEPKSGNVTRASIARRLGVESSSISVPRDRLIAKGVIEPVGHGLVRFTLPGFGDYLRSEDAR